VAKQKKFTKNVKQVPTSKLKSNAASNSQSKKGLGEIPKYVWGILAILLLSTYIAYKPSLDNGFVNWDDEVYVVENSYIGESDGWFKRIVSLNYHPLTMISLHRDYKKPVKDAEIDAKPFHLTNLILHLFNTALVFVFIALLTRKKWVVATFTAMLFALHPMHVESVAWISERKDVLYVFFFFLGLISWHYYREKRSVIFYVLSLAFLVLSCLSKAMAVVFPVVLLLIDYYEQRILQDQSFLKPKYFLEKLPHFGIAIFFGLMAVNVQGGGNFYGFFDLEVQHEAIAKFDTFTIWQRFTFASYGFIMYIVKLVVPTGLSTFYPYPNAIEAEGFKFMVMPFLVLIIFALAFWLMKKRRWFSFGIFFYFITVALVLQFLSVGKVIIADRYTYLPYVGLGFILGYGAYLLMKNKALKFPVIGAIALLGGFWAVQTSNACAVWKDGETLWTNVIQNEPDAYEAYINRGNLRGKRGEPQKALDDFLVAVQMKNDDPEVFKSLGNTYGSLGDFQKSVDAFNKAIALNPNDYSYYLNRGVTYGQIQNDSMALMDFEKALSMKPPSWDYPVLLNYKAIAAFAVHQNEKGVETLEKLAALQKTNTDTYARLLGVYRQLGDKENEQRIVAELKKLGVNAQ
jgi:tetratricopeptide (TPR) repeat protein